VTLQSYRRPPRRGPRRIVVAFAVLASLAVGFVLGLSVSRALDDGPEPARTQTSIRTLRPLPLPPTGRTSTAP
jgi:hypothetical protein